MNRHITKTALPISDTSKIKAMVSFDVQLIALQFNIHLPSELSPFKFPLPTATR
jgi:hypothetical protein